jgi:hypothetical protein
MMRLLSLATVLTASLAIPAFACEQHQSHASLTVAETAPPPEPMFVEPVQVKPVSTIAVQPEINPPPASKVLGTAYENCNRSRKDQTVYYTQ